MIDLNTIYFIQKGMYSFCGGVTETRPDPNVILGELRVNTYKYLQ